MWSHAAPLEMQRIARLQRPRRRGPLSFEKALARRAAGALCPRELYAVTPTSDGHYVPQGYRFELLAERDMTPQRDLRMVSEPGVRSPSHHSRRRAWRPRMRSYPGLAQRFRADGR